MNARPFAGLGILVLAAAFALGLVTANERRAYAQAGRPPCGPVWIEWARSTSNTSSWTPYQAYDSHEACDRSLFAHYPTGGDSTTLHYCFPDTIDPRPSAGPRTR